MSTDTPDAPTSPLAASEIKEIEEQVLQVQRRLRRLSGAFAEESAPKPRARIKDSQRSPPTVSLAGRKSVVDVPMFRGDSNSRQKIADVLAYRRNFFAPYEPEDEAPIEQALFPKCTWLACAALSLSYVAGRAIQVEDVMRVTRLSMHYASIPCVTLAELGDIIKEYLEAGHAAGMHCELATFDDEVSEESPRCDINGTGDRPPVPSLVAFRKELYAASQEGNSIYLVNYDPFVVQEDAIVMEQNMEEPTGPVRRRYGKSNMGEVAIVLSYQQAIHSVTVGTLAFTPDGSLRLRRHTCALQTLYKACYARDRYSGRRRGFVRLCRSDEGLSPVPPRFPIRTLDGSDDDGMLMTALDASIAPHILGLGLVHHLVHSVLLQDVNRYSTRRLLRGIPVTRLCNALQLPLHQIVSSGSANAITLAYVWYLSVLKDDNIAGRIHVGMRRLARRDDADDGAPNMTEGEFCEVIQAAVDNGSVLLLAFDVCAALNIEVEGGNRTHFAVVAGFDPSRGIALLADVNVKKFGKVWHAPLLLLYSAMFGRGYLLVSTDPDKVEPYTDAEEGRRAQREAAFMCNHLWDRRFEYPQKPYVIVPLVDAFNRLGHGAAVEDVMYGSGFDVTFLLSPRIPLLGLFRVARYFSEHTLRGAVVVDVTLMDEPDAPANAELFGDRLRALCDAGCQVVVGYNTDRIRSDPTVWNGTDGSAYAVVARVDDDAVVLVDANPLPYFRGWACPLQMLFNACGDIDAVSTRARGFMVLRKSTEPPADEGLFLRHYDVRHALVHHPFKPCISSPAAAMALALTELGQSVHRRSLSEEDIAYADPTASLTTLLSGMTATRLQDLAEATGAQLFGGALRVSAMEPAGFEELDHTLSQALRMPKQVVILLYDAGSLVPRLEGRPHGAGLVAGYAAGTVAVVDANPTTMRERWTAPLTSLTVVGLAVCWMR